VSLRSNVPDYTDYAGPLPEGLTFSDTPAQVHQKLGPPSEGHDFLPKEFWSVQGRKLCVTYDKPKTKTKQVSISAD
jgi:hypothetical protein